MKRGFIAVLLTLAMLFTLCACGGKTTEPDESEPTVPPPGRGIRRTDPDARTGGNGICQGA